MNIYDPVFSSSQAAKAAGMTATNFRAHLARGNWRIIGGDKGGHAAEAFGKGHFFTIYDVLGYALAHRLVLRGVEPKMAFERAMYDFAHSGDPERDPGGIFNPDKHGLTLFVYTPGLPTSMCVGSSSIGDAMMLLYPPGYNRASEAIVISINDLRDRVFQSLGLDARDYEKGVLNGQR